MTTWMSVIIILLALVIVSMRWWKVRSRTIWMTYIGLTTAASAAALHILYTDKMKLLGPVNGWLLLLCIVMAVVFYMVDFLVLNMVRHQVVILDVPYYFKGKVDLIQFAISLPIVVLEELVFRSWLEVSLAAAYPALILSSISFGAVHLYFSRYDAASKAVLGLVLGLIFVLTGNLIYTACLHGVYNLLVSIKKRQ